MKAVGYVALRRGIFPHLKSGRLSQIEFMVYVTLIAQADYRTGIALTCAMDVYRDTGLDVNATRRALVSLEAKGYIRRFRPTQGNRGAYSVAVNRYHVRRGNRVFGVDAAGTSDPKNPRFVEIVEQSEDAVLKTGGNNDDFPHDDFLVTTQSDGDLGDEIAVEEFPISDVEGQWKTDVERSDLSIEEEVKKEQLKNNNNNVVCLTGDLVMQDRTRPRYGVRPDAWDEFLSLPGREQDLILYHIEHTSLPNPAGFLVSATRERYYRDQAEKAAAVEEIEEDRLKKAEDAFRARQEERTREIKAEDDRRASLTPEQREAEDEEIRELGRQAREKIRQNCSKIGSIGLGRCKPEYLEAITNG